MSRADCTDPHTCTCPTRIDEQPTATAHRDTDDEAHRLDGPAWHNRQGDIAWFFHGDLHRLDGPALCDTTGHHAWHLHDAPATTPEAVIHAWLTRHRPHAPASTHQALTVLADDWHFDDTLTQLHTLHATALAAPPSSDAPHRNPCPTSRPRTCTCPHRTATTATRTITVDADGHLHHAHEPALTNHTDGTRRWYRHGQLHRDDGPAIERVNGRHTWALDGATVHHRRYLRTWLTRHRLHMTQQPIRDTLDHLAATWQPGDSLTDLHAAALAAHT